MAVDENVYTVTYKGVQLGDELTRVPLSVQHSPASITRLFKSPVAAIRRVTTARLYRYVVSVRLIKADLIAAMAQVEQYDELADDTPGDIRIYKGVTSPSLQRTIQDAYLEPDISTNPDANPSLGRFLTVDFVFVTDKRSS